MKNLILVLVIAFSFCNITIAQVKGAQISIGTNFTISSKILNQDREIQIYLPNSYTTSEQKYDVLYILDGQRFFTNGVAIQKSLRTPIALPEMIVVGINSIRSLRRNLYGDESEKFTSFLKDEIIKFIDSNYRTTNERVIFGWEAAAYYISEMILSEKELFSGAIITDGGYASEDIVKEFNSNTDLYLYMANSKKDIYYVGSTDAFNEILIKHNPKNLIWKYEMFNDEVHQSLPHLAMYKGLKYYYHNYDSLVFESIESYEDLGGMQYLNTYFKERANRFEGVDDIDDNTKNGLIWLAWNKDNYKYFSFFMTEFKDVLSTPRYGSAYWQNRFGQFYLKHKDYKNAIKYFENGISTYPNSTFDASMKKGLKEAKIN